MSEPILPSVQVVKAFDSLSETHQQMILSVMDAMIQHNQEAELAALRQWQVEARVVLAVLSETVIYREIAPVWNYCQACGQDIGKVEAGEHAPDCPVLAARALLAGGQE
jgi:hypothetical protein